MNTLEQLDLKDQRVLMRVDFNVPLDDGVVDDNYRIRAALPSVRYCLEHGAALVLISHLGRPGGKTVPELSLLPVAEELEALLNRDILFSQDCISDQAVQVSRSLQPGAVHLLENLRFHPQEEANEAGFSARLAQHGTLYVNEAFGSAHRAHASNLGVVSHFDQLGIGFLMARELEFLRSRLERPQRPFAVVLGGAKVAGKLELVRALVPKADRLVIGGGLAFTFLRAQGKNVGGSLVDQNLIEEAADILARVRAGGVELFLPSDVVAADEVSAAAHWGLMTLDQLGPGDIGVDIGPETCALFAQALTGVRTVFLNGPMGVFELPAFRTGTEMLISAIANATLAGAVSVVGGGDSVAAIQALDEPKHFTHVSTGGGAALALLSGAALPALEVLS